jgi:uncharacterized protein
VSTPTPHQPPWGWQQPPPPGNTYGWGQWVPRRPPRPSGSRTLVGVLVGLIAAVIGTVAVGAVLLYQQNVPTVDARPPQTSTLSAQPTGAPPSQSGRTAKPTPTGQPTPTATTVRPTPKPTTAKPTSKPTPTPTFKHTPKAKARKPTKAEDYLVRNPLYSFYLAKSDCSQPPRPIPTNPKGDQRYLKNLVGCLRSAYGAVLKKAGFRLTTPGVVIYTGTIQTPCGQGLKGYPVFYCGANEMIYSSAGSTAAYGRTLRLGGYWIMFHEFGHHVQQRMGVLIAAYTRNEPQMQISRRIELQADCFMGMTSISVRSTKLRAQDRAQMTTWREAVPDVIHGKSASQLYWVNRGFGTDDFALCSTWRATKHIS